LKDDEAIWIGDPSVFFAVPLVLVAVLGARRKVDEFKVGALDDVVCVVSSVLIIQTFYQCNISFEYLSTAEEC
jgi:hypothetical protein